MTIVEIYPAANGLAPIQRIATAPRDVANSTLLLLYCSLSVAEICVALAAVLVSGIYYQRYHRCLLNYMPNGKQKWVCCQCTANRRGFCSGIGNGPASCKLVLCGAFTRVHDLTAAALAAVEWQPQQQPGVWLQQHERQQLVREH